jgi:predicted nucleic acid-binding protein
MKPTVFIETTIPSFYFEARREATLVARRLSTRRWWDRWRAAFNLITSEAVLVELGRAPEPKRSRMLSFMSAIAVVEPPAKLEEVVSAYVNHRLMPRDAEGDARHVALASLVNADYLLTWNCRHIANQSKTRHLAVINKRLGISVPVLATPDTLVPEKTP